MSRVAWRRVGPPVAGVVVGLVAVLALDAAGYTSAVVTIGAVCGVLLLWQYYRRSRR